QKSSLHFLTSCIIPVRNLERARIVLSHLDGILQSVNLLEVILVTGIDQYANSDTGIAGTDHLAGQCVTARAVIDWLRVLVFVDYLHRHEMLAGIGQRNRHRTTIEVEKREGIQGVAVGPDNASPTNRREVTAVPELAKRSALGNETKIDIGLGAIVVVDGDRNSPTRRSLRTHNGAHRPHQQCYPYGRTDLFHPVPFLGESSGRPSFFFDGSIRESVNSHRAACTTHSRIASG